MKLSLLFPVCFLLACATAVQDQAPDPAPTTNTKKDASTGADANKGSQMQAQDSGVMDPDTGVEEPDTGSNGNCSLLINYGSQNCQTCMQGCCSQDNACVNSQDCVALINCLNACSPNDSSCVQACRGQHQTGASLFDGITSCMGSVCKSSCP